MYLHLPVLPDPYALMAIAPGVRTAGSYLNHDGQRRRRCNPRARNSRGCPSRPNSGPFVASSRLDHPEGGTGGCVLPCHMTEGDCQIGSRVMTDLAHAMTQITNPSFL